jgi:hypothetical protein
MFFLAKVSTRRPDNQGIFFSGDEFLLGAKAAYKTIMNAMSAGDREALKSVCSADVYAGLSEALAAHGGRVPIKFIDPIQAELTNISISSCATPEGGGGELPDASTRMVRLGLHRLSQYALLPATIDADSPNFRSQAAKHFAKVREGGQTVRLETCADVDVVFTVEESVEEGGGGKYKRMQRLWTFRWENYHAEGPHAWDVAAMRSRSAELFV